MEESSTPRVRLTNACIPSSCLLLRSETEANLRLEVLTEVVPSPNALLKFRTVFIAPVSRTIQRRQWFEGVLVEFIYLFIYAREGALLHQRTVGETLNSNNSTVDISNLKNDVVIKHKEGNADAYSGEKLSAHPRFIQ